MAIPLLPRGDEGLTKYCSWDGWYQDGRVQVPHVRKIATNGRRFAKEAKFKCGDTDELVRQFIEEYQVKLGHTYLLDTALGAYEAWGSNNNGDAFREVDLMVDSDDHGYRSFKKHAHVFRHHQNSDPAKAVGKVVLAAYNRDMKRVEVIEELNDVLAGDLLQKWANEGSLPTSMGCKVAHDVCSICGNRAPSARVYCEHAKYAMNRVWEDGRKVCVWNPNPKFFDQSHVIIPAEKIAGTMMKVASANDVDIDGVEEPACVPSAIAGELRNVIEISEETQKVASQAEEPAEISEVQAFAEADPTLPLEVLESLASFPLHKVASTLTYLGIVPKPEEWQYLVLSSQGHDKLAAAYHEQGVCFDPDVEVPELTPDSEDFINSSYASTEVAKKLAGWVEQRSVYPEFLGPRIEKRAANEIIDKHVRDFDEQENRKSSKRMAWSVGGGAALGAGVGAMLPGNGKRVAGALAGGLTGALAGTVPALYFGLRSTQNKLDEKSRILARARREQELGNPFTEETSRRIISKTAAEVVPPEKIRKGDPSIPATMAALGVSYGLMRAIQGSNKETLEGLKGKLGTSPVISALLIAAGVAAALRLGSSHMNDDAEKKPEAGVKVKLSSLLGGGMYGSCITTPWGGKTAAGKGLGSWVAETPESIKSVVLPFGLGYMSSAYYRAKQMQGQPTSGVQNVVAEHPLATGVGAVGAVAAVRRALKR